MASKVLYLISFLDSTGMALILPLINPNVIALGGSLSLVGILHSLTSGAKLFASPVIGSWSDTRGRKLLLISTLFGVFISDILSGIPSLITFFIARILYGALRQTDTLMKAIMADQVPKDQLPGALNKLMATLALAFVVAPILGGILFEMFGNFFYISAILCMLDIATISLSFLFVEESVKPKEKEKKENISFWKSMRADVTKIFRDLKNVDWSRYGELLRIKFFLQAAFNLFYLNMGVILMKKFLFTRTQLGFSVTFMGLVMITSNLLSSYISKKFYKNDVTGFHRILHGFIVMTISFCAVPFANTAVLYLSLFIPLAFTKILADSTWMEVLSSKITDKDKGVMMGAADSMLSLAGLICPLISGFIGDFIGIHVVAVLPILPSIVAITLLNTAKSSSFIVANKKD